MLDYLKPDFVHVLMDGRIVRTGDASLGYALRNADLTGSRANWLNDNAL